MPVTGEMDRSFYRLVGKAAFSYPWRFGRIFNFSIVLRSRTKVDALLVDTRTWFVYATWEWGFDGYTRE
jgi:hypothetical protein